MPVLTSDLRYFPSDTGGKAQAEAGLRGAVEEERGGGVLTRVRKSDIEVIRVWVAQGMGFGGRRDLGPKG